jgi:divalent metal cation (Fe/Co/Zn/Cd) transporter
LRVQEDVNGVSVLPIPLVERSEKEIAEIIKRKVESIEDVRGCRQLSVRLGGKRFDVEMFVLLDDNLRLADAHKIALNIEREIMDDFPNARVTIHTEPVGNSREHIWKLVKDVAEKAPGSRGVHNIHIQRISKKLCIDLHLEVSANMTVKQAHDVASQVEEEIKAADPTISEITVHIESASERVSRELAGVESELESYIEHLAEGFPEIKSIYGIKIRKFGGTMHLVLQCHFDPNLSIEKAHEISSKLENAIKKAYPNITRIDVHEEPD